jgi:hypothetical protein
MGERGALQVTSVRISGQIPIHLLNLAGLATKQREDFTKTVLKQCFKRWSVVDLHRAFNVILNACIQTSVPNYIVIHVSTLRDIKTAGEPYSVVAIMSTRVRPVSHKTASSIAS